MLEKFYVKRLRPSSNRLGKFCGFLESYWNAEKNIFVARPFATPFPANEGEAVKEKLEVAHNCPWRPTKFLLNPLDPEDFSVKNLNAAPTSTEGHYEA